MTGDNKQEIIDFCSDDLAHREYHIFDEDLEEDGIDGAFTFAEGVLYIETLEGTMKASEGDYIVRGVDGEYYPVKSDIFEKTYEEINTEE